MGVPDELLHRASSHPGRPRTDARAGLRSDRQRRLGQRVLPARRRHDRLRRGQGGGREPQQVALAGVRAEGHPRQLRLPGTGRAPTSGSATHGVAATVANATGVDADTSATTAAAAIATGRSPRRRRSRRWSRSSPPTHRQRHRRQLRDRRRPDQDDLTGIAAAAAAAGNTRSRSCAACHVLASTNPGLDTRISAQHAPTQGDIDRLPHDACIGRGDLVAALSRSAGDLR